MLLILLVSCKYKDLYYEQDDWADVTVGFDWQQAQHIEPEGMTVLFYREQLGSTTPERYDYPGKQGGKARLRPGEWKAVGYNYDTETILYQGMESAATLEAYTRQSTISEGTRIPTRDMPRAQSTEDQPVILEPDALCGGASSTFPLTMGQGQHVTITPQMRTKDVVITITNVPNLQYCTDYGGALSGLAPSVLVTSGILGEGCVTEAFSGRAIDAITLEFRFRIFGHCPESEQGILNPHLLTIYIILADGSKWYYVVDVSNQMHGSGHGSGDEEIDIEVNGLPVPKPIVNGSGFQPTIDSWQGVEINVDM